MDLELLLGQAYCMFILGLLSFVACIFGGHKNNRWVNCFNWKCSCSNCKWNDRGEAQEETENWGRRIQAFASFVQLVAAAVYIVGFYISKGRGENWDKFKVDGFFCEILAIFFQILELSCIFNLLNYAHSTLKSVNSGRTYSILSPKLMFFFMWIFPFLYVGIFTLMDYFFFQNPYPLDQTRCLLYPSKNSWLRPLSLLLPYVFVVVTCSLIYKRTLFHLSNNVRSGGFYTARERKYLQNMKNHFVLYILFLVIVWIPSLATFITAKATLDHTIIYAFCLIKGLTVSSIGLINSFLYGRLFENLKKFIKFCTCCSPRNRYDELRNSANING